MTSYLSENEAENLQNGDVHLVQIPDFEIEYLENHFEVGDGSFFCIFRALSFEFNFFFRPEVPFKSFQFSLVTTLSLVRVSQGKEGLCAKQKSSRISLINSSWPAS